VWGNGAFNIRIKRMVDAHMFFADFIGPKQTRNSGVSRGRVWERLLRKRCSQLSVSEAPGEAFLGIKLPMAALGNSDSVHQWLWPDYVGRWSKPADFEIGKHCQLTDLGNQFAIGHENKSANLHVCFVSGVMERQGTVDMVHSVLHSTPKNVGINNMQTWKPPEIMIICILQATTAHSTAGGSVLNGPDSVKPLYIYIHIYIFCFPENEKNRIYIILHDKWRPRQKDGSAWFRLLKFNMNEN